MKAKLLTTFTLTVLLASFIALAVAARSGSMSTSSGLAVRI